MTITELSPGYQHSAALIGARMSELRRARAACHDAAARHALERRILELKPLYLQCRELAQLTAHYYDRRYCRNGKYSL